MTAIKIIIKNPPWKAKPRPLPIITNWIGCSLPEISWAISKQNYPQMHVCPIILVVISAATTLQTCSLLSSSSSSLQTTAFSSFFFFNMKFMAASVLPPAHWGRKKGKGRGSIYTVCLYSARARCRVGSCDVFALSVKGSLVAPQLEK